jgi:hypothetical protein
LRESMCLSEPVTDARAGPLVRSQTSESGTGAGSLQATK